MLIQVMKTSNVLRYLLLLLMLFCFNFFDRQQQRKCNEVSHKIMQIASKFDQR